MTSQASGAARRGRQRDGVARLLCGAAAAALAILWLSCHTAPDKPAASRLASQARRSSAAATRATAQRVKPVQTVQRMVKKVVRPPARRAGYGQLARFLAGRPSGDSPFSQLEQTPTWIEHSRRCNQAWMRLERGQLAKIASWTNVELREVQSEPEAVFYPFAGPDFLYAHAFFPTASDYVLVGLEPFGSVPPLDTFTEEEAAQYLDELLVALEEILKLSFFKTNDMKEELGEEESSGVLPILLFFLARTNHDVLAVERVYIGPDGDVSASEDQESPKKQVSHITARRIWFQAPGSAPKRLYYFSFDLSNHGLRSRPGFANFVKKRSPVNAFVKAASYLMYRHEFADVRSLLLGDSAVLVQDDSGVPLSYFSDTDWTLRFYGSYLKPIELFEMRQQPRLAEIYATKGVAAPLPFGFGYRLSADRSNLMLAERKRSLQ